MPEPDDIVDWITDQSDGFAATIRANALDNKVPGCPDWTLRDLVGHLARVQRFWANVVRAGGDVEPAISDPDPAAGRGDPDELAAWMRDSTADLLGALRSVEWNAPAWTWWKEPRTVGAIARHQAQEAAVHRWDAQSTVGTSQPLPAALAADGVDEFLGIARQLGEPAPITFFATDTDETFEVGRDPKTTVSATVSDLVLLLYGRRSLDEVALDGDRAVAESFLVPIE
jgi:uncharacterized protein (TIGR03083 family)